MTTGVVYFLCGNWRKYLAPLVVSLHSLRQHWSGPVCILMGEDVCNFSSSLADIKCVPITPVSRHAAYVTKASLWRYSPFDRTLLLDADTVVTGPIDELFEAKLTATRFCKWITTGKIVSGRLRQWSARGIREARVEELTGTPHPALNTGVVAWHRDAARTELEAWERLTQEGWQCSFTDELAMQILWPEFEANGCRLLDDRYNCSAKFGVHRDDARIWHYHGRSMIPGRGNEMTADLYRPHLRAALDANVGGMRDWIQEVDPPIWELSNNG